ncbi:D-3-phosphoglycerate dehydrogenase [Hyphomicrobium denitrificans 1NES1]|uniref:D-3-phosphoglycerate dehydrogenase n=1 Tax=Hyphomicrobium denitrificans 1NES1 TaxID=670307 RepID=N0B6T9_9HYPH|nr:phosphoglycerate dehydrogenase [Hyphomicrobium denitrificans]AGK59329.1 D-3-phosphoglycerate dehydrogenase [Hyphomicrobium denitrificans 1NES1]
MPDTLQVLIADPIHEDGRKLLATYPDIHVDIATGLDEEGLILKIPTYDALIVRSKSRVTRSVIEAGRALKAIGRAGIGVDNIDISAATEHGIVVFNTPDANATTTAELTVAHMMSLSRHLPQADRSVRSNEWQPTRFVGTELAGKTVGIIGFGTIGRLVAERCAALKMKVLAYDPYVTPEIMCQYSAAQRNLDSLLASSDYVTLHCPLTDKTHNLIDATRLSAMKSGARLINCARGGLVDEKALLDALRTGHIAGAALDVFAKEPPLGSEFIACDNVVLTPHLGASTKEAQQAVSVQIAEDVAKFLTTGEAESAVNLPRVSSEQFSQSRPYQTLALALGRLAGALTEAPISELVVRLFGRIADFDPRPITVEAVIGLLESRLAERVNRVNATHLATAQGIEVRESRSQHVRDYLSLIEICVVAPNKSTTVAGTLLGGRQPHLVRIDSYHVEAPLGGHFLFTRHRDQPGVVGTLGGILGREKINISRMNVGVDGMVDTAIALIGVSAPLPENAIAEIRALPVIFEVFGISL